MIDATNPPVPHFIVADPAGQWLSEVVTQNENGVKPIVARPPGVVIRGRLRGRCHIVEVSPGVQPVDAVQRYLRTGERAERVNLRPDRGPVPIEQPRVIETERIAQEVTVIATAFGRSPCVRAMLSSFRARFPNTRVIIADNGPPDDRVRDLAEEPGVTYLDLPFDCGISRARNAAVAFVETPFILLTDDDAVFLNESRVDKMLEVIDEGLDIGVVGGSLREDPPGRGPLLADWAQELTLHDDDTLLIGRRTTEPDQFTPGGVHYYEADTAQNLALMRTQFARENPWNNRLKVQEHWDFYLRAKLMTNWRVAVTPEFVAFHNRQSGPEYNKFRDRTPEFWKLALEEWGLNEVRLTHVFDSLTRERGGPAPEASPHLNVIVTGIGNSGTTPLVKLLHAMGWYSRGADRTFGEHDGFRELNNQAIESGRLDTEAARALLRGLQQPWALKDPRFIDTAHLWLEVLEPYRPAMLVSERSAPAIERSWAKRGERTGRGQRTVRELAHQTDRAFEAWPWQKQRIALNDLIVGARAINESRETASRLSKDRAVHEARQVDGWMNEADLGWLYDQASSLEPGAVWVEIGTYKGRSTMAVAAGLPEGSRLITVDHNPPAGMNEVMRRIEQMRPDITLSVCSLSSVPAAIPVETGSVDVVFLDGTHTPEAVCSDCLAWAGTLKEGGLLCGHDVDKFDVRLGLDRAGVSYEGVEVAGSNIWAQCDE